MAEHKYDLALVQTDSGTKIREKPWYDFLAYTVLINIVFQVERYSRELSVAQIFVQYQQDSLSPLFEMFDINNKRVKSLFHLQAPS